MTMTCLTSRVSTAYERTEFLKPSARKMTKRSDANARIQIPLMKLVCNRSRREHCARLRVKDRLFSYPKRDVKVDISEKKSTNIRTGYRSSQLTCKAVLSVKACGRAERTEHALHVLCPFADSSKNCGWALNVSCLNISFPRTSSSISLMY